MEIIKNNINLLISTIISLLLSISAFHFFDISMGFALIFIVLIQQVIFYILKDNSFLFKKVRIKDALFSLIFSILIVLAFSSSIFYKENDLIIKPQVDDKNVSQEIWLCNITSGIKNIDYNKYLLSDGWSISDRCLVHAGTNDYPAYIEVNSEDMVKFDLLKSNSSGNVELSLGNTDKSYNLYSDEEEYINVGLSGTAEFNLSIINLFYIVSLILSISLVTYMSLGLLKKNKYSMLVPLTILYSTIVYYLNYSKSVILLQFVLLILAYLGTINYYDDIKKSFSKFKIVLFVLLAIIIDFLIYGEQIFLNFNDIAFYSSLVSGVLYLLCLIPAALYIFSLMYLFDNISKKQVKVERSKGHFWLYFGISFICLVIWMIVFYPGNYSSDSVSQVIQALTGQINDAHPAIMTLIIKGLYSIFKTPFAFIVFQCAYLSLTIGIILNYLYKKGFSNIILSIIALIISIMPCTGMMSVSLWKDIIYSNSLLLLSYYTYRIIVDDDKNLFNALNILLFIISFVFTKEFRHNGMAPFLLCSILYILIFLKRKDWKLGALTIICIVISTLGIKVLYNVTNVEYSNLGGSVYNSVVKNFGATLYYNGNLSMEANTQLNKIDNNEFFVKNYYPNNIDYYFYTDDNSVSRWLSGVNNYRMNEILPLYIDNIFKNPGIFVRDKFDSMDVMLDSSFKSYKYPMFVYFNGVYNDNSEIEKEAFNTIDLSNGDYINNNIISEKLVMPMIDRTVLSNIMSLFVWKTGLYFVLYLVLMFYLILKNKAFNILALTPIIGNTLSWFLVLNHPSVRYVYYLNFSFIFMMMLLLIPKKKERGVKIG